MEYKWTLKNGEDPEFIKDLATQLTISEDLTTLLVNRNIRSFEEAKSFFRPELDQLHDPFLMKDMDKAVSRLTHAVEKGQNILVYGDYDVDGTTSVSLVYSFSRAK